MKGAFVQSHCKILVEAVVWMGKIIIPSQAIRR